MAKKILIVEDNPDIRYALKQLVELKGYEVIEAAHGYEARDLAVEHVPDLILMDLVLPVLDGLTATREIRAHAATSHIPIIAVTSYEREFETEAIIAGCNEVVSKRHLMDNFDATLKKYLGGGI